MTNILITGGLGFVGSHLIDLIIERVPDAQITVVDNLSSNAVTPEFAEGKPVKFLNCSIQKLDPYGLKHYDEIYHLASIVGPAGVLPFEGVIVKEIVDDAHIVAHLAMVHKARLVFVSTSEVYGGGQSGYCKEDMDCVIKAQPSARLEYALGKLGAETSLLNLGSTDGLDVVIIRPFNIAGARQQADGGFVLPRFIEKAKAGEPLQVFGSGQQVRALTDVRDVADGIYRAMQSGEAGEIYNIGNEANKTLILDLAFEVIELLDSKSEIEFIDPMIIFGGRYFEANDKFPDSDKAQKQLGWEPKYSIEDIIRSAL
jgi:UDP-glucose 4-epimerase